VTEPINLAELCSLAQLDDWAIEPFVVESSVVLALIDIAEAAHDFIAASDISGFGNVPIVDTSRLRSALARVDFGSGE
jgi:hypothetical protein